MPAAPANSLPPTPVPADTLSHRHGPRLASQPRAAHQQPEVQRVQPAAGSLSAKPGAQAAGRAAEGKLSTQLQQQQQPALPQGNRMLAATLSAGRAAVGTPQGQQQSMVRPKLGLQGQTLQSSSNSACGLTPEATLILMQTGLCRIPLPWGARRCLAPWITCYCNGMGAACWCWPG